MKIITTLVLLAICGITLEVYYDWAGQSGNGTVADSNMMANPVDTDQGTADLQAGDDEAAAVADQVPEDTDQTDTPAVGKVQSDTEQENAIQQIDMNYTKIIYRV